MIAIVPRATLRSRASPITCWRFRRRRSCFAGGRAAATLAYHMAVLRGCDVDQPRISRSPSSSSVARRRPPFARGAPVVRPAWWRPPRCVFFARGCPRRPAGVSAPTRRSWGDLAADARRHDDRRRSGRRGPRGAVLVGGRRREHGAAGGSDCAILFPSGPRRPSSVNRDGISDACLLLTTAQLRRWRRRGAAAGSGTASAVRPRRHDRAGVGGSSGSPGGGIRGRA